MIKWDEKIHSVGVQEMDDEHKVLFEITSEIYNKIIINDHNITDQLFKLVLYTKQHFNCEIKYLNNMNISSDEIDEHNKEHDDFLNRILDKIHDDINGKKTIALEVIIMLNSRINEHILNHDKEFFKNIK